VTPEGAAVVLGLPVGYFVVTKVLAWLDQKQRRRDADTPRREPKASQPRRWFEVLELDESATADEIRAAYRRLIVEYHPDKVASLGKDLRELAGRKSAEITAAYQEGLQQRF
jgi:DnaJ like chaperone protein